MNIHQKIYNSYYKRISRISYSNNEGSRIIKNELTSSKPSMIARFGSNEIKAVLYPKFPLIVRSLYAQRIFDNMETCAGFFPADSETITQFSEIMLEDTKQIDILGSWRIEEYFLKRDLEFAQMIPLNNLEPYFQLNPWSEVLANKKVLVVHPFSETIEYQYENKRELLFKDKRILPRFKSLQTVKAVQTIAGNRHGYHTWFEALEDMKKEIEKCDFEIAIIGCGAYGFPLAAHVKRLGKKAIHLGGATQMLFGIKGKRWLERENFKNIINEHFVFPLEADRPSSLEKVEGGCYW